MEWLKYVALLALGLLILWGVSRVDDWLEKREKQAKK